MITNVHSHKHQITAISDKIFSQWKGKVGADFPENMTMPDKMSLKNMWHVIYIVICDYMKQAIIICVHKICNVWWYMICDAMC